MPRTASCLTSCRTCQAAGGGGRAEWKLARPPPVGSRLVRADDLEDRPGRAGRPKDLRGHDINLAVPVLAEALDDVAEAVGAVDEQLPERPQSAPPRPGHKEAAVGRGERRGGTAVDVSPGELRHIA